MIFPIHHSKASHLEIKISYFPGTTETKASDNTERGLYLNVFPVSINKEGIAIASPWVDGRVGFFIEKMDSLSIKRLQEIQSFIDAKKISRLWIQEHYEQIPKTLSV